MRSKSEEQEILLSLNQHNTDSQPPPHPPKGQEGILHLRIFGYPSVLPAPVGRARGGAPVTIFHWRWLRELWPQARGPLRSGKGTCLPFLWRGDFGEAGAPQPFPSEVLTLPGDAGRTVVSGIHGIHKSLFHPPVGKPRLSF